jgi:hypothetical protein
MLIITARYIKHGFCLTVALKYNGQIYTTLPAVGKAVMRKGAVNDWNFWKYERQIW